MSAHSHYSGSAVSGRSSARLSKLRVKKNGVFVEETDPQHDEELISPFGMAH